MVQYPGPGACSCAGQKPGAELLCLASIALRWPASKPVGDVSQVLAMEEHLLGVLHFELTVATPKTFLRRFIQVRRCPEP